MTYYQIADLIERLPKQQQYIIQCRYYEGMTLQAIGDRLNLNRERVRQLESKALWAIRSDERLALIREAI